MMWALAVRVENTSAGCNQFGIGADDCTGVELTPKARCTITIAILASRATSTEFAGQLVITPAFGNPATIPTAFMAAAMAAWLPR